MQRERIDSSEIIRRLKLEPHPEGGFFRETYRASGNVVRENERETRSASTAIYFLLCDGAHSAWHRIRSDEVWHFYAGDPIDVHVLKANRTLVTHRLGNALDRADAVFQTVVEAGDWFAAECHDREGVSLVGCTVAPGFEFSEFELAVPGTLEARYPQHRELIERLNPEV
ncbi:cupin domain-containing protein [Caballeronia sp. LZ008]|uniref:cupin domain-containing protein n=1 Tax=unclassified Caballeronia TaxID=2646786 RepID=UPI002027C0D4|nr:MULTISPECIES: cupin domain-containing protein [unclassified Caballeronia]MDR5768902.1 cupin domain-containing protein [Caballeronia sp. LZ028]MDR5797664.1 cupin domain-containing protein [Caballeronia sp. LZ008]